MRLDTPLFAYKKKKVEYGVPDWLLEKILTVATNVNGSRAYLAQFLYCTAVDVPQPNRAQQLLDSWSPKAWAFLGNKSQVRQEPTMTILRVAKH